MTATLLLVAVAVVAHEGAHYLTARALGLNTRLVFRYGNPAVAYWVGDGETVRVSRTDRRLVSLAGPAANLVCAVAFGGEFRLVSVLLGLSQLIPVKGSDGWRAFAR